MWETRNYLRYLVHTREKKRNQTAARRKTSLLCLSDVIVLCRISAYSGTARNFLKYENAVFNGEQEKESIICVTMG